MSEEQERLPLKAKDGSDLPPPPPEEWREHTSERWLRDDPNAYRECIECVKRGELNKSRLAKRFQVSRNTVLAMIVAEFSVEQLREINGKIAAIVTGEALAAQDELIESASVKELGAVSISGKAAFDIAQLASGGPTERRESISLAMSVDDFKRWVESESGIDFEPGKVSPMPPTLAADSGTVVDVGLSGFTPPQKDMHPLDTEAVGKVLILLLIQVLPAFLLALLRGGGG